MSDEYTTKDIVDRLDQLIALWKLANREELGKIKNEIEKDDISKKILELTSEDGLAYSELAENVAKLTNRGKRTVELRIMRLSDLNLLNKKREGKKVLYSNSGILE